MRCSNAGGGIGIRRALRSLPVILGAVLAAACTSDGAPSGSIFFVTERAAAFLELEDDFSESYTAVVLSDTHFSAGRELPEEYYQWLDEISEERRTPRLSYYFLDTADGLVGLPQYSALEAQMASDSNPKVVLSHVPLYSPVSSGIWYRMKNAAERARLLSLLAGHDVRLLLCGHLHERHEYSMGAFREIIVDSVQEHCSWGLLTVDESAGKFQYETVRF